MDFLTKHTTANNLVLKIVAMTLFIVFPLIGFILGMQYQVYVDQSKSETYSIKQTTIFPSIVPKNNQQSNATPSSLIQPSKILKTSDTISSLSVGLNDRFKNICSSAGLQPTQMTCICDGKEVKPQYNDGMMHEGTETICQGKIISRTCTNNAHVVVDCGTAAFPSEIFK